MRLGVCVLLLALCCPACALFPEPVPDGTYTPRPKEPRAVVVSETLYRVAEAAGDDPRRYSFALVKTEAVTALSADHATFYFSEGLARRPAPVLESLVAQAVSHEVLGHRGKRRSLALSVSAGFTVAGLIVPGLGMLDFLVNPVVVRAYDRDQNLLADQKAAEILGTMGYGKPKRTLAEALVTAAEANGPPADDLRKGGILSREPDLDLRIAALGYLRSPTTLALKAPALDDR